ncbi:MAG: DNA translocase FtsK 4TM domain-containing protein [Anaerolineae bacterium]|nr:DNA translocase FtsK 4TM domain-containing protein [Anaerolineae bacterium]
MLLFLALFTVLSLLSQNRGILTQRWLQILREGFGVGIYVVPLGLAALGLWLAMVSSGRSVQVSPLRIVGVILLVLSGLGLAHHLADPARQGDVTRLGGRVGGLLSVSLTLALGWAGSLVALLTILGIGLSLALEVDLAEVAADTVAFLSQGMAWVQERWPTRRRRARPPVRSAATSSPGSVGPPPAPSAQVPSESRAAAPDVRSMLPETGAGMDEALIAGLRESIGHRWLLPELESTLVERDEAQMSLSDIREKTHIIEDTLRSLGVPVTVVEVNPGPVVTQYGLEPGYVERRDRNGKIKRVKVKVSRISALSNDLALALAAAPIRIETPVPGKGIVGLEVPNINIATVGLRGVIESPEFRALASAHLAVGLGRDVSGTPIVADLAGLPHLLIAGATGSGKSVCINALIACLLLRNTPDDLKLLMIDPKRVELSLYNGIPHLVAPVVVEVDRVVGVLSWVTREMDRRYKVFAKVGARHIAAYNEMAVARGESRMPLIVVFIDELADLMMVSPDEVERSICRIAQLARATGIHLVIATQRPSVDVVTGLIKANFPARISFAVSSSVDSRVVLDTPGAEKLLGRGDCLYMAPDTAQLLRVQGCYVSDEELLRLVAAWKAQHVKRREGQTPLPMAEAPEVPIIQQALWPEVTEPRTEYEGEDPLLGDAITLVVEHQRASVSFLQRRLRIGYTRAGRLVDLLYERGVIGPPTGSSKARDVLLTKADLEAQP